MQLTKIWRRQDLTARLFFFGLALLFASTGNSARAAEMAQVEQWGVFELTLNGPRDGNPFTEIELSAQFTHGSRSVPVTGFYDGEGVYKVRFMPDVTGEWRYETTSNRQELKDKTGAFTATPPSKGNHGPVRVANTFHFAYADGTPYRQIGTTSYSWIHQGTEREEQTLRTLAGSPFNKIRMCVFPQNNAERGIRLFPFEGTPPSDWNTSRFNPEFFRHLETRVGQLRELGIEADVILFHPYGNRWPFSGMDPASDDRYVRYIVARLAAYRNVWWSLCNEWDFLKTKHESDWDRIFQVIQKADPYARLRSIHNAFVMYNNSHPWVSHASIQQGAAVLDPERAVLYRDVWRKPVVYDEVKYEGNHTRRWGQLKAEELVSRFWNGTIAGTYVGHSEILGLRDSASSSGYKPTNQGAGYWLGAGGELRGESPARLSFLKKILDESPSTGLDPIDKWQERRMGGKTGEYYLLYFGKDTPSAWPFVLPREKLTDGMQFSIEVIDTWNMTITPIPGTFETKRKDDYDFIDKNGRSVPLPGKPYMAIRLRRVGTTDAKPAELDQDL